MADKEWSGREWKAFAWGAIGVPIILGAVGLTATVITAIAAAIVGRNRLPEGEDQ